MTELAGLPAGDRIARGLSDLRRGEVTVDALLVSIASRRLAALGLPIPAEQPLPREPELALYQRLGERSEDPFFAYRAALAELDSFLSALEARRAAGRHPAGR